MWPLLISLLAAGLLAFHFWHWRRNAAMQAELARVRKTMSESDQHSRDVEFQARAQLQTLFNSMVEGVMLVAPSGRVQLVNQSLEHQFNLVLDARGLTVLEALGRTELAGLIEKLKGSKEVVSVEIELDHPVPRCLEVNAASIFDRDGHPQGAILVFHDLTRIRQLENTRREFVANVSHELRTPLSLIKGFAETLLHGALNDPTVASRFLQKIELHSNRLHNLIEDLLTISKLESGQVSLRLDTVDLCEFSTRQVEDLQGRALDKNITIANEIPSGLRALADLDRLQQVFFNLLDNAIKYGRKGGRITLNGRATSNDQVELCVSDDGPGIPRAAQARIFERFFRVDKARSRDTGGTGLGLSIVKHIVQSHGGEVWVDSEPGRGASFFFTLPKPPLESEAPPHSQVYQPPKPY